MPEHSLGRGDVLIRGRAEAKRENHGNTVTPLVQIKMEGSFFSFSLLVLKLRLQYPTSISDDDVFIPFTVVYKEKGLLQALFYVLTVV